MNMVCCGENCRYQVDGYCTRSDLKFTDAEGASKCCYYEKRS